MGFSIILTGCLAGNEEDNSIETQRNPLTLQEQDFAQDQTLKASPDHLIIVHLETQGIADSHQPDSYKVGIDRIPIHFPANTTHRFQFEHKEGWSIAVKLHDAQGREVFHIDKANPSHTADISAGTHILELHHTGFVEEGTHTVFIRPGTANEAASTARKNGMVIAASGAGLTYVGGDCSRCDLSGAFLRQANLTNANLTNAIR